MVAFAFWGLLVLTVLRGIGVLSTPILQTAQKKEAGVIVSTAIINVAAFGVLLTGTIVVGGLYW